MKYLLTTIILLSGFAVSAQETVTISGKLIDLETKEPLSFSTLNIQNTPKGVVANEEGAFDFTISKTYLTDSIVFSMAGYQSEKIMAQRFEENKIHEIGLISKEVVLAEVVVTNKELTAWDILDLALKNVKHSYAVKPFEFEAFYRDYKIEDDQCVGLFEAAITVYDKGYSKVANKYHLKEKVKLDQVRKSLSANYQTHAFKRVNVIKEILRLNDVRYQTRGLNKKRDYEYSFAGYEVINDRLMHKIRAFEDWEFHIYVDVITYAIPKIEMNFEWEDGVAENEWTLGDTVRYQQRKAKTLLEFQMIDGLYYPKYQSFSSYLLAYDAETDELLFDSNLLQEYMVTDIDFNPEEKPEKKDRMDPYEMIENQTFTYDPEFWKNYNIIKLHPRDEKLIQGLEDQMKLEEQFATKNQ